MESFLYKRAAISTANSL